MPVINKEQNRTSENIVPENEKHYLQQVLVNPDQNASYSLLHRTNTDIRMRVMDNEHTDRKISKGHRNVVL